MGASRLDGDPDATSGLGADGPCVAQPVDETRTVLRANGFDPVHPSRPFAPGVRRYAPDRQAARGCRFQEETFSTVDCLPVTTQRGSIDPFLQAVHRSL